MGKVSILVLNGPNLNLLGTREVHVYGSETIDDLVSNLKQVAEQLDVTLNHFQSNHEGALVDAIQQARIDKVDCILINAGAYTHTSVAIRDALLGVDIPFYEIHISNIHKREEFRHHSYLSDKAVGVIVGFGLDGYEYALNAAVKLVRNKGN